MRSGVINIYKERGYTSHDVVAKLRGILKEKKIGHTGTLDPDAEGVLPVCLGKATKLCDMLTDRDKVYEAVLLLGRQTDTQDTSGTVLAETPVGANQDEVRAAVLGFVGDYAQIPPMYSALKVNGQKLVDLARAGKEVERKARPVTIYGIEILDMALPRVRMRVSCSKGTYIRTLCHDIGETLGCHGCMESLLRVKAGPFALKDSVRLTDVERFRDEGRLPEIITPTDALFEEYPRLTLLPEAAKYGYNGNAFEPRDVEEAEAQEGTVRVYDHEGAFIGIYAYEASKERYALVKMFYEK